MGTKAGREVTGERFEVRIGRQSVGLCHIGSITSSYSSEGEASLAPIILRRAVGADQTLWHWHMSAQGNRRTSRIVTIALLGDDGQPLVTWRLEGCRPIRSSGPTLDTLSPVIACEEVEIAFDRVTWL